MAVWIISISLFGKLNLYSLYISKNKYLILTLLSMHLPYYIKMNIVILLCFWIWIRVIIPLFYIIIFEFHLSITIHWCRARENVLVYYYIKSKHTLVITFYRHILHVCAIISIIFEVIIYNLQPIVMH